MRLVRTISWSFVIALVTQAHAAAQTTTPPAADPVVAEIRALRAEMVELLHASVRSQLLVARLQLQEQRILSATRQLQDVETRIRQNEKGREQAEQAMKMFEAEDGADNKEQAKFILGPLKAAVEKAAKMDAELRLEQTQLQSMVHEEQQRWSAFNARLDELEQIFTRAAKPKK